ncbi:coiled-coil domain-containing protein 138-like isoform X2 [Silurus meridionalis]|uniref:coiled-coil domain-containing protein 138-like isoform X2 n=1 Tax=Silurus meridionalis TaxID=175797 RepID=UPI001EEB1116|nr:coiled-coil domain-containing protein 138-like isoform X2 [Silurus meridionalis]
MNTETVSRDLNRKAEMLQRKYLERRMRVSAPEEARVSEDCGRNMEKSAEISQAVVRTLSDGEEVKTSQQEMKKYSQALQELFHAVSDPPERLIRDESVLSSEDVLTDLTDALRRTEVLCTETDMTLPSNLVYPSSSFETEPVRFSRWTGPRSPAHIEQVHQEMIQIYEKLQVRAASLCEREHELQWREKLLLKQQSTITRLMSVEEDVLDRINVLQQRHQQEVESLRAALREKNKENKRMKSSLDSMKELNISLKKQLSELSEQNGRLEIQSQRTQARLENLQRKQEHSHRGRENIMPKPRDPKPSTQDKALSVNKSSSSSSALKLLHCVMEWMVDGPYFPSQDLKTQSEVESYGVPPTSLQERCAKVLPVVLEQFQQAETFLHLPLLRFIYCSLTQLENSSQHLLLTSTLRRLGEEVNRKSPPLFRSSCPHTRFLSSIIILKTLSQADVLAQALCVLHGIVGEDEGRGLFLKYKALTTILAVLRTGSPGLLAAALEILLQMSAESQ